MSSSSVRLWFLMSLVAVVIALLAPSAMSKTDKEEKRDDVREAQVIKVVASCTRECHDLCAVLPKSEDPICDRKCDSMSMAFNGTIRDPNALDPQMLVGAAQEIQLCSMGCFLRCIPNIGGDAGRSCKAKCADTFRHFRSTMALLAKTMEENGLAAPATPQAPRKDDFKFEACSDACSRKCVAGGKTKQVCGGSCAETCSLYAAATAVLQAAMPAVPSPAALGDPIANTFKVCKEHCSANDNKCVAKCSYACYIILKAKATMKLATGGFGVPA